MIAVGVLTLILPAIVCDSVEVVSMEQPKDIIRADLHVLKPVHRCEAVLLLCPGCNGNGGEMVLQLRWQEFAHRYGLGLAGLSFASEVSLLTNGRGYYYVSQGSGQLLLDELPKAYGRDMPLLLYGFSGGAHFTSRFLEWKPERVVAWCAYSAGWWDTPKKSVVNPPGIVACGDRDERYGASLMHFKQGRALGKPWLWLSVPNTGHSVAPAVEEFVRAYFAAALEQNGKAEAEHKQSLTTRNARNEILKINQKSRTENLKPDDSDVTRSAGAWVDIDLKCEVGSDWVRDMPSVTGWLPDARLMDNWLNVHEP